MGYHFAFFTTESDSELADLIYRELAEYCKTHPETDVSVFTSFGTTSLSGGGKGEYEIVNLPDLFSFDGVVFHSSQFQMPSVVDELMRRIYDSERDIPAVSIDLPIKGADYIGTDNFNAQRDVVAHVVEKCGAKRLAFIAGPEESREAYERERAFLDYCEKSGIPEEDYEIYEGDWSPDAGIAAVRAIMMSGEPFPDVLVCANDDMALGAAFACSDNGILIPEDLLLTGFDDIHGASVFEPQLTTVNRDFKGIIDETFEHLEKALSDEIVLPRVYVPHVLKLRDSTEYHKDHVPENVRFFMRRYLEEKQEIHPVSVGLDELMAMLFEARRMQDIFALIEEHSHVFSPDPFFLCINEAFYQSVDQAASSENIHYSKRIVLTVCAQTNDAPDVRHVYEVFDRSELLPKKYKKPGHLYLYYPLHYREFSIGYMVFEHTDHFYATNRHQSTFLMVAMALENLRKRKQMDKLNMELEHLYVKDSLTGLYNRFGMQNEGVELFDRLTKEGEEFELLFIDVEDMKHINELYGHDAGDKCLVQTAGLLERAAIACKCEQDTFLMRYSGDEFIVVGKGLGDTFQYCLREGVDMMNRESFTNFHLGLSITRIGIDPAAGNDLEYYISMADKMRFQNR